MNIQGIFCIMHNYYRTQILTLAAIDGCSELQFSLLYGSRLPIIPIHVSKLKLAGKYM